MKSREIAPLDQRKTISKDKLLDALKAAEETIEMLLNKRVAKHFVSMRNGLDGLRIEIDEAIEKGVLTAEDKVYERIINYWKLLGDFNTTLDGMEKKIAPEEIKDAERAEAKNIVTLVRNANSKG